MVQKQGDYCCARCKKPYEELEKLSLEIHRHHKDGNHKNDQEDNIELLCEDCHFYVHNEGEYGTELLEKEIESYVKNNLFSEGYILVPVRLVTECGHREALLYGTILALSSEKGYCYASNRYLAKRLGTTEDTIGRWLRRIKKYLFIIGHQSKYRRIYCTAQFNLKRTPTKIPKYSDKNPEVKYSDKNPGHNNINNNDYNNINSSSATKKFKKPSLEEIKGYCKERENKIDPEQFMNYYESKGWMIGKNKMKNWKAAIRTWESRIKESTARKIIKL